MISDYVTRDSGAYPLLDVSLKSFAHNTVNRIRTAAADRDDEAYCPDQQYILVSAATGGIPFRQMHE